MAAAGAPPVPALLPHPRHLVVTGTAGRLQPLAESLDPALPAQGYRLRTGPDGATLAGRDPAGLFYGRATLAQLGATPGALPGLEITDWPDLPLRGVSLDVSRDKVPTLATLQALIARLASWKVNHVQLYMEHTFAYRGHQEVWATADPYTPAEMAELGRFCRGLHVELAPNQNCLGHMERWLVHPRYRHLAARPEGVDMDGRTQPPATLRPAAAGSLALVQDLLGQLVPCFDSRQVHVGLDEPFDLYTDRRLAPEHLAAYLAHLRAIRAMPEIAGREMLVWGDVLEQHPEALGEMPDGVTVVQWNYGPEYEFTPFSRRLAAAGRTFWTCASTGTFATVGGRLPDAILNQRRAVAAAIDCGGGGFLDTEWGDRGYHHYPPVIELPLAFGAAAAWCLATNAEPDPAAIDRHVFLDGHGVLRNAVTQLGSLHRDLPVAMYSFYPTTVLPLYRPDLSLGTGPTGGLRAADVARLGDRVDAVAAGLSGSASARDDAGLLVDELRTTCRLLRNLLENARLRLEGDGSLASIPAAAARRLAGEIDEVAAEHRRLWLARNRPGGLADSLGWFERLGAAYREVAA